MLDGRWGDVVMFEYRCQDLLGYIPLGRPVSRILMTEKYYAGVVDWISGEAFITSTRQKCPGAHDI